MPKEILDDVNKDLALPSGAADQTASTPDDNPLGADPEPQPSSGAGDPTDQGDEPKSIADVIDDVLDPDEPKTSANGEDGQPGKPEDADEDADEKPEDGKENQPGKDDKAADADLPDDPTEEELASYRKGPRKRIDALLAQRKEAREQAAALKPDADNYQAIRSFMRQNSLADQEVADLFKAGADLKSGDPKRLLNFISVVQPLLNMALEATGQMVPQDLRTQVESGEVSEEVARQLAASRHQAAVATAQAQAARAAVQTRDSEQVRQGITTAVNTWAATKSATDPDFARKQEVMRRMAQGIVAEKGIPQTPADAVAIYEQAYAEANRALGLARTQKAATRPTPSAQTSGTRTGVQPAPQSLADVIDAVLQ